MLVSGWFLCSGKLSFIFLFFLHIFIDEISSLKYILGNRSKLKQAYVGALFNEIFAIIKIKIFLNIKIMKIFKFVKSPSFHSLL